MRMKNTLTTASLCLTGVLILSAGAIAQTAPPAAKPEPKPQPIQQPTQQIQQPVSVQLAPDVAPSSTTADSPTLQQLNPAAVKSQVPMSTELIVVAEPAILDIGDIPTNDTKVVKLKLVNTGDKAMTVLSTRCSCGCTSLKLTPNTVIEAKQSIELDVQMSGGAKAGPLAGKSCTFVVEGQPEIVVPLKANAVSFVASEPEVIDPQIQADGKFILKARDGQPFKVISMQPAIITEFPAEAAAEQTITLDWAKFREIGVQRKATFYLDHPKCQMAMVDINFTPEELQAQAEKVREQAIKDRSAMNGNKAVKGEPMPDAAPAVANDPDSQLTQLIREGKTSEVIAKLGTGLDVNYKNATNVSLLGQAALHGNVELIKALVATGKVEIDFADNVGRTPLMQAAQSKNPDAVRELLMAGASPSVRDQIGGTALSWAAGFGDAESVQELIDAGSDADIVGLITGWTPLIWAAGFGDPASIEPIIAAKGNIEHADNLQGATALVHAARTGKVDSVKALVKHGANLESKDRNGYTPLLVAAATSGGDVEKMQALLDLGANLEAKDNRGFNALDLAMKRTDMRAADVVKLLQDKGITPTPEKTAPAEAAAPAAPVAPATGNQ